MQRMRRVRNVVGVIGIVLVSACSTSDDALPSPDAPDSTAADAAPTDDDLFTEREAVTAIDDEGQPVEPVAESLPPVAETGVPGIDSDDAFCRSWSTAIGSIQAIIQAWDLQAPQDAARLEIAAGAALAVAVEQMADNLPAEIESNRQAITVDVPAPYLRRAERAATFLAEEGLDAAQIDELGRRWIEAITEQGVESETLSIDVPADSIDALERAGERFRAELPPTYEDPSLDTTDVDIGPSVAYAGENCPDQGTLAGNDVIEAGAP